MRPFAEGGKGKQASIDIEPEPLPDSAFERVEAMIGVDATGTEQEPLRSSGRNGSSPPSGKRIARCREGDGTSLALECKLDRGPQRGRRCCRAGQSTVVADAHEDRRTCTEARKRASRSQQANERWGDPATRSHERGPVERNAFLPGVVAPRAHGEVAGPDEEEPNVAAAERFDARARAQEAVDCHLLGVDLDRPAVGADEDRSHEAFSRSRAREHHREHNCADERGSGDVQDSAKRLHDVHTVHELGRVPDQAPVTRRSVQFCSARRRGSVTPLVSCFLVDRSSCPNSSSCLRVPTLRDEKFRLADRPRSSPSDG